MFQKRTLKALRAKEIILIYIKLFDLGENIMKKSIKKYYLDGFREIFTKEEYYEYILYSSKGMSNYKKRVVILFTNTNIFSCIDAYRFD